MPLLHLGSKLSNRLPDTNQLQASLQSARKDVNAAQNQICDLVAWMEETYSHVLESAVKFENHALKLEAEAKEAQTAVAQETAEALESHRSENLGRLESQRTEFLEKLEREGLRVIKRFESVAAELQSNRDQASAYRLELLRELEDHVENQRKGNLLLWIVGLSGFLGYLVDLTNRLGFVTF